MAREDDEAQVADAPQGDAETTQTPTLRERIDSAVEEVRKAEPPTERRPAAEQPRDRGRFAKEGDAPGDKPVVEEPGAKPGARRRARDAAAAPEPGGPVADAGAQPGAEAAETDAALQTQTPEPPPGWPKDAAEDWRTMTATQQAAVTKRLTDAARGVEQLRTTYAEIDRAVDPYRPVIQQHRSTPAAAIEQLFAWHMALANNPAAAFPALAKSFGVDLTKLVSGASSTSPAQPGVAEPKAPLLADTQTEEPQYVKDLRAKLAATEQAIGKFGERFTGIESTFEAQNTEKTKEAISFWAKDKPHFPKVQQLMGRLIASGAVPLKDGRVDLDGAYSMAVWADPAVRAELEAEAKKAAKDAAARTAETVRETQDRGAQTARRAAVSVAPGSPGPANGAARGKPPKKGASVRESLDSAVREHRA